MEFIRIDDNNFSYFEDIIFMENHTPGVPLIMLGALDEGRPVAASALEIDGRVSRLVSIYVEKPYRKGGIGKKMVKKLFDFSKANGLETLEVDFVEEDGLQEFFEKTGFLMFFGNEVLYLPLDEVVATKQFKSFLENADKDLYCKSFSSLSKRQIVGTYQKAGIMYESSMDERINADYSAVLMAPGDQPAGLISIMNFGTDLIITDLLAGDYGVAGYSTLLLDLYKKLIGKKGKGLFIGFIGADDKKMEMVSEIAGDMIEFEKGETIVHGILV